MENISIEEEKQLREGFVRKGLVLEYLTIGYNCLEGFIAVISGFIAASIALVGFGFDSFIEVASASILLWRLRADVDEVRRERTEQTALKLIGISFMLLALYVCYDSIRALFSHKLPDESMVGIVLGLTSLLLMPLLVRSKRKVARQIQSKALAADAKQTLLCTYLSAILLGGLLFNALLGWWWADPVAGLLMVPIIVKEGIEALKGKSCCEDQACS